MGGPLRLDSRNAGPFPDRPPDARSRSKSTVGAGRSSAEASGGRGRSGPRFLPDQRGRVPGSGRRRRRQVLPGSVLRRGRTRSRHLHWLRGLHAGCRHNAKNTLDKNYLYLAEKHGARVFSETRVVDVVPIGNKTDGSDGYEVITESSTAWFGKRRRRFTCDSVVFAASALGSMDLLFRLKQKGSLPAISDQLGKRVRTNAESLIGVRIPGSREDLSKGVAIGSGIYLDEYTHIERPGIRPVRTPWAFSRRC